jgi:hypothetical protein
VNPSTYLRPARRPAISKELPGTTLENLYCLRCNRELEAGHKSVAVYMFAQTVGVRPRQKSAAQRICFCPQCSVSLAMGPPPEGAFNVAAWKMIREVVSADPALQRGRPGEESQACFRMATPPALCVQPAVDILSSDRSGEGANSE